MQTLDIILASTHPQRPHSPQNEEGRYRLKLAQLLRDTEVELQVLPVEAAGVVLDSSELGRGEQSNDPGNNQHILNTPTIGRRCHANGTPCHIQHSPNTPTTGLRERGDDTNKSTGRSGRQKVATRRNMRREERVTVKEQQPDGMSHRRGGAPVFPTIRELSI